MSQSYKLIELSPQIRYSQFIVTSCSECKNNYVIYKAFKKMNEALDDYRLIEMVVTNYCPFCGSNEIRSDRQ